VIAAAGNVLIRQWLPRLSWLILLVVVLVAPGVRAQGAAPVGEDGGAAKPRLTKPPKLVKFVEAPYPEQEKAAGRTASVVLQIAISTTGSVDDARVLESAGAAFDEAALGAVRGFVFEPAELDHVPAAIRINYRYDFVFKPAEPTTCVFKGVVRVRPGGEPLAGVAVELDDGHRGVTDEQGRFSFEELEPGKRRVTLSRSDLKALQTEEVFEIGKAIDAIYEVDFQKPAAVGEETDDLEIVILAPTLTKQVVSTKVEADQAKRVAGTQGDVLKVVENMPGVARAAAGSGQVVVWGAAPEDTRIYVDGVRVPLLYHFGGFRSVVHSDLVQGVELTPGGYGSAYGRGLGGLVTVDTRAPSAERRHGSVGLDLLDASAQVNGPISGKLSASAAVRRSHLDWVLSKLSSKDLGEFFPIPKYYDAQARVRYQPSSGEWIELGGLLSSDQVSRTVSSADPANRKRESQDLYFDRLLLRYHKQHADGAETQFLPWIGRDHARRVSRFGGTPSEIEVKSTQYGLRTSHRTRVAPFLTATVGLDMEASDSSSHRVGSITTPAREGDARVFGEAPSDQVNVDDWSALLLSAAPSVEGDFSLLGETLHVVPGVRLETSFASVDRRTPPVGALPSVGAALAETALEPRVSVRYALSPRVSFKAAYGRYHQPALPEERSSVFGNPLLGTSAASHWLGGGAFNLSRTLTAETTVFYAKSSGLVVRNPSSSPLTAQALLNVGQGRSYGAQFLLRREQKSGFFGWVAYTILRSERRDSPSADWRLFDFDQTHVLTALASYDLGRGFDVGARVRYATGYPRTPVLGAYDYTRTDSYQPVLGSLNSIRIPDFVQLDVRASKRIKLGSTELELYADVQNVTDRENAEELVYSADYSEKRTIRGLPILPVLGAKWEF
jgi:TonB family protein